jgi:hypothetical protein
MTPARAVAIDLLALRGNDRSSAARELIDALPRHLARLRPAAVTLYVLPSLRPRLGAIGDVRVSVAPFDGSSAVGRAANRAWLGLRRRIDGVELLAPDHAAAEPDA